MQIQFLEAAGNRVGGRQLRYTIHSESNGELAYTRTYTEAQANVVRVRADSN
ncbi:hypothetical protein [Herbaspirillum sp. ST 5-3]|uniref:hypothetical protein n=1 Tax=Oxalobacteraceae TaxID=75682 RepID=UPI00145622DE|nr:hypothetical protein [Herbaspirillum sp. ST 5-3]